MLLTISLFKYSRHVGAVRTDTLMRADASEACGLGAAASLYAIDAA